MFKYIIFFYLITRLVKLTLMPIFIDEANYLDWGWRMTHTPNFAFYSLYDAKPPGIMWLYGIAQSIFSDPLLAGRLVTVFFGLITLIGLYKLSPPSTIFYILTPVFLFFDRQALMETPLTAIGVWAYYFSIRKKPLISAGIIGLGMLIKTNAAIFLIPTLLLSGSLLNLILGLTVFFVAASPVLFQPLFWSTLSTNSRFSLSLTELFHFPVFTWITNLWSYFKLILIHFNLLLIPIIVGLRKSHKSLLIYCLLSIALIVLTSRSPNLRYLAPFLPLLLLGFTPKNVYSYLSLIPNSLFLILLIFIPPIYLKYFEPAYITGRNSGYLVNSVLSYISTLPKPLTIGIAENSGNPEAALLVYFNKSKSVQVTYFDKNLIVIPVNYECLETSTPFYFIARRDEQAGMEKYLTPTATITSPYSNDFHTVYTLRSNCPPNHTLQLTN